MIDSVNLRGIVLDLLTEVNENGQYSHVMLNQALTRYQYLEKTQRAFITRLFEGTLERQIELDYMLDCFSQVKTRKMKPLIRNLLRMSVYQIKYMDSVPDSAACDEAVKLARKRGFKNLAGFVNGVLRNISRKGARYDLPDKKESAALYFSVAYAMPLWIAELWLATYGEEKTEAILKGLAQEKPMFIRCNTEKISVEGLEAKLHEEGVETKRAQGVAFALEISGYDYLREMESFAQGLFYVQDISSMLAGLAAAPQEGSLVLDVCSAPGGKALNAALLMRGTGCVRARDVSVQKTELIAENISRLGLSNVTVEVFDGRQPDAALCEKVDVVLVDAPCSGLGVIGRKADIRHKMNEEKQAALVLLQQEILACAAEYVKPGGTLVYSTCTLHPRENEDNVRWICEHTGLVPESLEESLGFLGKESLKAGWVQIFPGELKGDGFFIAKFKKPYRDEEEV